MRLLKPFLTAVAISAVTLSADAIIAKRDIRTVTQPDGTTLRVRLIGDEASHYLVTEDGTLLHEADGIYTFGKIAEDGQLQSTGILATQAAARTAATTNINDLDIKTIDAKRNAAQRRMQSFVPFGNEDAQTATPQGMQRAPQTGVGLCTSTYPRTGSPKGLIILVQYQDVKFTHPDPAQYFGDMINKKGFNEYGSIGSALDYFTEQSGGQFTPSFDVYGPITLSNNRKYYGQDSGGTGNDIRPQVMVTEGCRLIDAQVDFSQYDTDKDGLIDNVFVFYAGQGQADGGPAESVWPHSWDVRYAGGSPVVLDGVTLAHYACSNEWDSQYNRPDGVGTFVHEFSHVMGLPDLYSTDQDLTCTPCSYSVLDYGPYNNKGLTPPNYGAYELNAMGWAEPITLDGPMSVTLSPISSNQFGLIATSSNNEFFLLENRQQTGWDKYIPGHGMLIWHIDYNASVFSGNTVNNNQSHQYVDIEEANNLPNGYNNTAMAGWPFPGTSGATSFTSATKPALKTWAGVGIDLPVTDIEEDADGTIRFNVAGGGSQLESPIASVSTPGNNEKYFIASWNSIEGATDYLVTVTAGTSGPSGSETADFTNSKLPEGWTSSMTSLATYTTATNFGQASPSAKFSTDGVWIASGTLPSDVTSISFWNKGMSTSGSTALNVEGLVDGNWTLIEAVAPKNLSAQTANITDIPAGVRQVRFTFVKDKGNIGIDDIVIEYGGRTETLPDYNNVSTAGATTLRVDKLKEGCDTYTLTVKATDGKQISRTSTPVTVQVSAMSGVEDIVIDNDENASARYYNLQGIEIANPTAGSIYIERRGNKARKVVFN